MTLHLDGHAYELSVDDYDPEHGASYAWEGLTPLCPACGDFLEPRELMVFERGIAPAYLCHTACGWEWEEAA